LPRRSPSAHLRGSSGRRFKSSRPDRGRSRHGRGFFLIRRRPRGAVLLRTQCRSRTWPKRCGIRVLRFARNRNGTQTPSGLRPGPGAAERPTITRTACQGPRHAWLSYCETSYPRPSLGSGPLSSAALARPDRFPKPVRSRSQSPIQRGWPLRLSLMSQPHRAPATAGHPGSCRLARSARTRP